MSGLAGVTLVGGAPVARAVLDAARARAPRIVAVDGGADTVLAAGLEPERAVGDLDSISPQARARLADRIAHMPDQDSTDLDKALRATAAPFFLGVGFLGARLDHTLAALSVLAARAAAGRAATVLLDETDCLAMAPARLSLDLAPGTRVSLWPLDRTEGRSTGLRWPIDGLALHPTGRVGTSNQATGRVELTLSRGRCALILPAASLDALMGSLGLVP
jgi:thiamine pyrophosphokinase